MRRARLTWLVPAVLLVMVMSCARTKDSTTSADMRMDVAPGTPKESAEASAKAVLLMDKLRSDNEGVRGKATDDLVKLGAAAVGDLIKGLSSDSEHVRYGSALALGRIGDTRATTPLLKLLKSEKTSDRHASAVALGAVGDLRAVDGMLTALDDEEESVRDALATGLGRMGPDAVKPLTKATGNKTLHIRWGALKALGELGPPRGMPVGTAEERSEYAAAMKGLDDLRLPVFLKALTDADWNIRWIATSSLGRLADSRALDPLVKALKTEENDLVRDEIGRALASLNDKRTVLELMEALRGADVKQRQALGDVLRRITRARIEDDTFDAWKAWYDKTR